MTATMAVKPRNFAAMREDRVLAMAHAALGRSYATKAEAAAALAGLSPQQQRALKKPKDGAAALATSKRRAAKPRATSWARNADLMRGGIKAPDPIKLADAKPAVVQRYARAVTGIATKSKPQALAMLAKYGPSDVSKAAGSALGGGGNVQGPMRKSRVTGVTPKPAAVPRMMPPPLPPPVTFPGSGLVAAASRGAATARRVPAIGNAAVLFAAGAMIGAAAAYLNRGAREKAATPMPRPPQPLPASPPMASSGLVAVEAHMRRDGVRVSGYQRRQD